VTLNPTVAVPPEAATVPAFTVMEVTGAPVVVPPSASLASVSAAALSVMLPAT
jgi:hypothetical protein